MDAKRTFDILFSSMGLIILSPVFAVVGLLIIIDSKGGVFYRQIRVGKNVEDFPLYKFRTMYVHDKDQQLLTIGDHDARVTKVGYWLRKYKLDELPQLLNVLKGHMSFVGPRPEVRKYVNLYNDDQLMVLSVKPGITDWASIQFSNESELLAQSEDPDNFYINELIRLKTTQNLKYINNHDLWVDLKIILLTLRKIIVR
ncbi:sugar transferase [Pedobacter hiemivivus]|uniref:Sugar transferase n=1 Tax=Pedobacter hiemivivus TaxID=2530454 RepID=A0A4U1G5Z1_9SPHI|nr:sugar transferase [Pedobacter hiemivivus]TCC92700.1 sugar transferase [Pedobacter hiemivivus]TKC56232.1 sugar transferase [Pedobacter hiemivivus]